MEKKPPTSPRAGAIAAPPPSGCCERLFHAFHLQPAVRRLPFRQHDQVVTPSPPSNYPPPPPPPAPTTTTTTVATTTTTATATKPQDPSHEKQKGAPVQTLLSVKSTLPGGAEERQKEVQHISKGEEAAGKTRRGFNLKVDEYINRTKNKMKNLGSNVGKTTTRSKNN